MDNLSFSEFPLNKIFVSDKGSKSVLCTVCQQTIEMKKRVNCGPLYEHYYSHNHIWNLTLQAAKIPENNHKKGDQNKGTRKWSQSQLFELAKAQEMQKNLKKKGNHFEFYDLELNQYFEDTIKLIPTIFNGLEDSTIQTYKIVLKRILFFLLTQESNELTLELAIKYLEQNKTKKDHQILKRLLVILDIKFEKKQFAKDMQPEVNNTLNKIPSSLFNKYFHLFQVELQVQGYFKESLAYYLVKKGMKIKNILTLTYQDFDEDLENCNPKTSAIHSKSVKKLVKKMRSISGNSQDHIYINLQKRDLYGMLSKIRDQLIKQTDDQKFKEFLKLATLKAVSETSKLDKKESQLQIWQPSKEIGTETFLDSSSEQNKSESAEKMDDFKLDSNQQELDQFQQHQMLDLLEENDLSQFRGNSIPQHIEYSCQTSLSRFVFKNSLLFEKELQFMGKTVLKKYQGSNLMKGERFTIADQQTRKQIKKASQGDNQIWAPQPLLALMNEKQKSQDLTNRQD